MKLFVIICSGFFDTDVIIELLLYEATGIMSVSKKIKVITIIVLCVSRKVDLYRKCFMCYTLTTVLYSM